MTADVVDAVIAAAAARDWDTVRAHIHPYVHWNGIRGRTNLLALLAEEPQLDRPSSVELRDGQIYRWNG